MVSPYWFILGILSVWRVTHLLNAEDGPWDLLARLRRLAGIGLSGQLLDCFYCLSLWVAVPFALLLGLQWIERLLLWLSLSAGAILLERTTTRDSAAPPAYFAEEGERNVLWKEKDGGDAAAAHH